MSTVTISKKEYKELMEKKLRYECLREVMEEDFFSPPPSRSSQEVLAAFRTSGVYNGKFLKSLKNGLGRSSYFKT